MNEPTAQSDHRSPLLWGSVGQRIGAAAVCIIGLGSVAPLLAWVFGLGSFAAWFWLTTVPGCVVISGVAAVLWYRRAPSSLRVAIVAGAWGGLFGTVMYDLVRIPFLVLGLRLFAPINSYGILIAGSATGSPFTDMLGWLYNFSNGVGFGIAFGVLALGRRWWWAIPFSMALETATIVTPYADFYSIRGKLPIIAIAYGAHVFYGIGLGAVVQRAAKWRGVRTTSIPLWAGLVGTALALVMLNHPWTAPSYLAAARDIVPQPATVVSQGAFQPEWLRTPVNGCVQIENRDGVDYTLSAPSGAARLRAHSSQRYCFPQRGVIRVQLSGAPYSGGFVLVDPAE